MKKNIDIISLNKQAWEHVADTFSKRKHPQISSSFKFFCDQLPERSHILDVGCGTGIPFMKYLIDRAHQVVGIDISPRMVQIARKNVPQAKFRVLSMTDLIYEERFEGVVASYSMLLLDPPRFKQVAQRIVSALAIEGLFYLSLNEPEDNGDAEEELIVEIMGEYMYSRGYTKDEICTTFIPLGMQLLMFQNQVITSKEFGEEHMMEFVFKCKSI